MLKKILSIIIALLVVAALIVIIVFKNAEEVTMENGVIYKLSDGTSVLLTEEENEYLGKMLGDRLPEGLEFIDAIIVGEAIRSETKIGPHRGYEEETILTHHTIKVHRYIKPNSSTEETLIIKTHGGCTEENCLIISHASQVPKGEFFAFLEKDHDGYLLSTDAIQLSELPQEDTMSPPEKIIDTQNMDPETRLYLQNLACPDRSMLSKYFVVKNDSLTMEGEYVDLHRETWTNNANKNSWNLGDIKIDYKITCSELQNDKCATYSGFFTTPDLDCSNLEDTYICKEEKSVIRLDEERFIRFSPYFEESPSDGKPLSFLLVVKIKDNVPIVINTLCSTGR